MPKVSPKHVQVAAAVRRMIRERGLKAGDGLPTEMELAAEFACSRGTVRQALETLAQEGLVRRKQGAGAFVARRERGGRAALIGLILPNILNAEVIRLAQLFTIKSSEQGYRIVLCVTDEQPAVEREFVREALRMKVSGVIKFPTVPETPGFEEEIRGQLRSHHTPCVVVNDFWTDCRRDHLVAFDEEAGVELAVDKIVAAGHQRIGWVDGSDGPRRRAEACLRQALERKGLRLREEDMLLTPPYRTPPVEQLFAEGRQGPTALLTPYDGLAVRLIEALGRAGLRVPQDVSVVNLNGQPLYATPGLELTTAVPPNEEIAAKALEILWDEKSGEAVRRYLFRPGFCEGRTLAAPRGRGKA